MSVTVQPATSPRHHADADRTQAPAALWVAVVKARGEFGRQRRVPRSTAVSAARADLLSALERYAASLTNHGRPIPYGLRDELHLLRLTRFC
jgi:hypothetical protein